MRLGAAAVVPLLALPRDQMHPHVKDKWYTAAASTSIMRINTHF